MGEFIYFLFFATFVAFLVIGIVQVGSAIADGLIWLLDRFHKPKRRPKQKPKRRKRA